MKTNKHIFIFELCGIKYIGINNIFNENDNIEINIISSSVSDAINEIKDFLVKQYMKTDTIRLRKISVNEK